jgi:hypothetical protein
MGPIKVGSCQVFNLENKALRPIGDLTINGIHVDTDILDENIISYDRMCHKQEMVEAFKNDATGVQASISALNVIQKKKMR